MSEGEMIGPEPPEALPRVRADALERASVAWEVRVRGGTWQEAADAAGYANTSNAMRSVRSVFGSLPPINRDETRRLWRDRLELFLRLALVDAREQRPGAITALVRIAEAAARLDGLAEPQRHSIVPAEAEIQRWVSQMLEASGQTPYPEEGDIFEAEVMEDDSEE